jgi:uncharacterized protein (DUF488 family)
MTSTKTKPKQILSTIGYEAADLADFIATLHAASVTRVIDVRELPFSRKKGFAKNALSSALSSAGIYYHHLKGLGDPKEGREAARRNETTRFLAIFERHIQTAFAQEHLREAANFAVKGGACLLCYERDHLACHRALVARAIADTIPIQVRHLGVRVGLGKAADKENGVRPY